MPRILFLGPPGAGKGTQAQLLEARLGLLHLATGDMLRTAVAQGSALGQRARAIMERGDLVPDALVIEMLKERIDQSGARGYILDGFPRTLAQAQALDVHWGPAAIDAALLLEVPEAELIARLLGRGRSDDTEATVRNRLQVYRQQTEPLVAFYQERGILHRVQGTGDIPTIQRRILKTLSVSATK